MAESMTEEERLEELTKEHDESLKRHFKPAPSIVPGCSMIELLDDVKITAAASTLHAGMYVLPRDLDIKGSAKYVREHKGAHVYLFTLELNELNVNLTPVEGGKAKPDVSGSTKIIPIRLSDREEPVSLSEAAVWAAINDADRAGDHDKAQRLFRTLYGIPEQPVEEKPKRRRPRKEEAVNNSLTFTNTKVEKAIFGDMPEGKAITADAYDGRPIGIGMGKLGVANELRLMALPGSAIAAKMDNAEIADLAESGLNDNQRFWLAALHSVVEDNPEACEIYGVDILRKVGYEKPLRASMSTTMAGAAAAIRELTYIGMFYNTTKEQAKYNAGKKGAKHVVRSISDLKIVNGNVSVEEYEDGTKDFVVRLWPLPGEKAATALPLLNYAKENGQYIPADKGVFKFDGCGTVTTEHRRVMAYIYRQASSELSNGGTILYDTMFRKLGLKDTKDTRYRIAKKIEDPQKGLLACRKRKGIVTEFEPKYDGRKKVGVVVKMAHKTKALSDGTAKKRNDKRDQPAK